MTRGLQPCHSARHEARRDGGLERVKLNPCLTSISVRLVSGDDITREILNEYKREHELLRSLHAKAREILAVLEAKDAREHALSSPSTARWILGSEQLI